jgi:hypothetical protein
LVGIHPFDHEKLAENKRLTVQKTMQIGSLSLIFSANTNRPFVMKTHADKDIEAFYLSRMSKK